MRTTTRQFRPSATENGAAAVEFAFILAIMILMVAGLVEFGRVMWHYDALAKSTRDGARVMSKARIATMGDTVSSVQAAVVSAADAARVNGVTSANVSVRCDNDLNDTTDYSCTDSMFTTASPPARVSVGISGYSITVGAILPMLQQDGTTWTPFSLPLGPKTSMPYMR